MLFNSLQFAVFLPVVFGLYWILSHVVAKTSRASAQNVLLLLASYVFYGSWDPRFLTLIVGSTVLDFVVGRALARSEAPRARRALLLTSLLGNLGVLATFKYLGFFVDSFLLFSASLGFEFSPMLVRLILPVGISFYTFQTLSYTIDVYRRRVTPTRDFFAFATFVAFFPQLVAGPIERARDLLPQFLRPRDFEEALASDGLRRILWGLVKKAVVADNLAPVVDRIFAAPAEYGTLTLVAGIVLFAMQIYCDFSGYSDIAIGTAALFGVRLRTNFALPYFSRSIGEFWRRWHISLSTWFRDYVYIPLGGNRLGPRRQAFNVLVVFVVSGFWHGANWTFLVWGLVHGVAYLVESTLSRSERDAAIVGGRDLLPSATDLLRMLRTASVVGLAWVFFRAESLRHAGEYFSALFSGFFSVFFSGNFSSLLQLPEIPVLTRCGLVGALLLVEWSTRQRSHPLDVAHCSRLVRWMSYYLCIVLLLFLASLRPAAFIYFQF